MALENIDWFELVAHNLALQFELVALKLALQFAYL